MRESAAQSIRRFVMCTFGLWALAALPQQHVACAGEPDHGSALHQRVARPSLPDFGYGKGSQSGVTHFLKHNGVFWSVASNREHPDKRDTEGDIVILGDGSLLLAWSDFYTQGWQDGDPCRISMRRSRDGGRTWGPLEVLQEQVGSNVMSVSFLRTSRGTVLFQFLCKGGPNGRCVPFVRRSTDDSKTFGPPILASDGHPERLANNDRLFEVRDPMGKYGDRGRIVLACRDYPARAGVMVYSNDDGLTWKAGMNVPVRSDWGSQNFNEPGIVELASGRFWMYGRTTIGFHAQAWSADRGLTWSRPEPMALRGPCSPLTAKIVPETAYTKKMGWAGHILFTFPNHDFAHFPRDCKYTARTPLDSAISANDARTWTHVRTIEEDPTVQYGYTSIDFQNDDVVGMRVLLTTHVEPIPGAAHRPHDLKLVSIPLSWFYEKTATPQHGIDFADEERHIPW
jgi:sialidase-1